MAILESRRWTIVGSCSSRCSAFPRSSTGLSRVWCRRRAHPGRSCCASSLILALTAVSSGSSSRASASRCPRSGSEATPSGGRWRGAWRSLIAAVAGILACLACLWRLGIHYGSGSALSHSLPVTFYHRPRRHSRRSVLPRLRDRTAAGPDRKQVDRRRRVPRRVRGFPLPPGRRRDGPHPGHRRDHSRLSICGSATSSR